MKSTKLVKDKRFRIDIAAMCEMKQNNCVEVKLCPGKSQLANSMTKRGASGIELLTTRKNAGGIRVNLETFFNMKN